MVSGEDMDMRGDGLSYQRTLLELKLRILKRAKEHTAAASALENINILKHALARTSSPDHTDGAYIDAIWPEGVPERLINDSKKIVMIQRFVVIYKTYETIL